MRFGTVARPFGPPFAEAAPAHTRSPPGARFQRHRRVRATPADRTGWQYGGVGAAILILTATRTFETLGATWDEISFPDAIWRIPASRMKMGEEFSVPLSDAALRLLGDQQRGKNPYIFPGRPRQPLSSMALAMLLRRIGVDATVHGFRTSFRTWCSDVAHLEFEVAESCLSHRVGSAVSRAYARSDMLERRRPVMARWADYVEGKDNVMPITKARGHARAPIRRA
jgi:integrase